VGEALEEFVRAMEPLGEKLGPLLVQLPAEFRHTPATAEDLATFLGAAPAGARFAIEFRHASWHTAETFDTLRAHGATVAWTEWRDLARLTEVTADFLYLRWLGDRQAIERYDRVQIDRVDSFDAWQADLTRVLPQVSEIYGYFNNHWAGHSPASANEMKRRLGLLTLDARNLWPQKELF